MALMQKMKQQGKLQDLRLLKIFQLASIVGMLIQQAKLLKMEKYLQNT
jgi:hypothetical protein